MSSGPNFQGKTTLLRQRRGPPATVGHGTPSPPWEALCNNIIPSGCTEDPKNQAHNVGFKATLCQVSNPPALMNILKYNMEAKCATYEIRADALTAEHPAGMTWSGGPGGNQGFQAALMG